MEGEKGNWYATLMHWHWVVKKNSSECFLNDLTWWLLQVAFYHVHDVYDGCRYVAWCVCSVYSVQGKKHECGLHVMVIAGVNTTRENVRRWAGYVNQSWMSLKFDSVTVTVLNVCGNVLRCVCVCCICTRVYRMYARTVARSATNTSTQPLTLSHTLTQ